MEMARQFTQIGARMIVNVWTELAITGVGRL